MIYIYLGLTTYTIGNIIEVKIVKKYFTPDAYKLVIAGDEAVVTTQLNTLKVLTKYKAADIEKDN